MPVSAFCLGGVEGDYSAYGFVGCMKDFILNSEQVIELKQEQNHGVINGTCSVTDK